MVVPTRRMKSTGTAFPRDKLGDPHYVHAKSPKALLRKMVDGQCPLPYSGWIAWDNSIIPGIEGCSSMILKSQIFIPNREETENQSDWCVLVFLSGTADLSVALHERRGGAL